MRIPDIPKLISDNRYHVKDYVKIDWILNKKNKTSFATSFSFSRFMREEKKGKK